MGALYNENMFNQYLITDNNEPTKYGDSFGYRSRQPWLLVSRLTAILYVFIFVASDYGSEWQGLVQVWVTPLTAELHHA